MNTFRLKWILGTAALLAFSSANVWAQAGSDKGQSASTVQRLGKAPVSTEILKVKLPKPAEFALENGLTVLILEDHRFPTVTVSLNMSGAGPLYEPADTPGLAAAAAAMLREGTKTRTSVQIAQEVDRLGATLNASTGFGSSATTFSASGLSDNFDDWFALGMDVLLHPTFPAEDLQRYKLRLKAGLRQQRSSPAFLMQEQFSKLVYGSHPAATISTNEKSLDSITPEMLAKWHAGRYAPQNSILGIAGDVDTKTLLPKLKQWLAEWKKTDMQEALPAHPTPATAKRTVVVHRPGSVQTDMILGNIAIERKHPDYVALQVMNEVYGNGPAARLFLNLRENKGYTYGVGSGFQALKYPGPFVSNSSMRTDVTEGAMTEFLVEIRRMRDEPVPAEELAEKERAVVARFALQLEQPASLLGNAIVRKIYGFPEDYWDTYPAKVSAITAADVQRVARLYLNPDTMQVVAVGDATKIKPLLEKFGPIEVFDSEGKPMAAPPIK